MRRVSVFISLICVIFLLCLSPAAASTAVSTTENFVELSSLEDDACIEFLAQMNVDVPETLLAQGFDVQKFLALLESNPYAPYIVNHTKFAQFVEEARVAVQQYYEANGVNLQPTSQYTLQNSTVYSWNASMVNYNCYAYALGRSTACNPGDFSGQSYNHTASISTVANIVKDDLKGSLGYDCVKVQSTRPTSSAGWANAIAVRKDTNSDIGFNDYHFAKLSSSKWYHKPGRTAVLKFNSAPTNAIAWTNEAYNGSTYYAPTIWYESSIMYLLYKSNHGATTQTWTGEHYHSGARHFYLYTYSCKDCGGYVRTAWVSEPCSGPPCAIHFRTIPCAQAAVSTMIG